MLLFFFLFIYSFFPLFLAAPQIHSLDQPVTPTHPRTKTVKQSLFYNSHAQSRQRERKSSPRMWGGDNSPICLIPRSHVTVAIGTQALATRTTYHIQKALPVGLTPPHTHTYTRRMQLAADIHARSLTYTELLLSTCIFFLCIFLSPPITLSFPWARDRARERESTH